MNKFRASSQTKKWLLPSVSGLVFTLIFLVSLYYMPNMMNADGDLGRHLTLGEYILKNRHIPSKDIFSHTLAGAPVIPHSWFSEVLFALSYRIAGLNGVAWLTALILGSTYASLTAGMMRLGVRSILALGAGLFAFVGGALHALTRPHIFTLLFFTLLLIAMETYRKEERWEILVPLPLMIILWANSHGAFISGITLVILYAIFQFLDNKFRLGLIFLGLGGVLIMASWLNPAGLNLFTHSFSYLQAQFLVDTTIEYRSPNFHNIVTWPFAFLVLFSIVLGWRRTRPLSRTSLFLLIVWTGFALYSARNIPLYIQLSILILTREVDIWIDEFSPCIGEFLSRTDQVGRQAWGWVWPALIVGLLIGTQIKGIKFDINNSGNTFDPKTFPVEAIDTLENNLPNGFMFNEFIWGGYLLYRLWPQKQVFIDGQTDFYGESITREYLHVVEASPGWEEILDKYHVQWIILPPKVDVAGWLDLSPAWIRYYTDEMAVVWVRR